MGERRVAAGIVLLGGALAAMALGGVGLGALFAASWLFVLAGLGLLLAERAWRLGAAAGLVAFVVFLGVGFVGSGVSIRGVGALGGSAGREVASIAIAFAGFAPGLGVAVACALAPSRKARRWGVAACAAGGAFLAVSAWIVLDHQKIDGLIPPLLLAAFCLTLPALLASYPRPARG